MCASPVKVMGVVHHNHHHHHRNHNHNHHLLHTLTAFTLIFFASVSASDLNLPRVGSGLRRRDESGNKLDRLMIQNRLVGPGSSPPTCRSKCGRCHPCKPVHVRIQPGFSVPLDYYPEAWRCKCGNKFFNP